MTASAKTWGHRLVRLSSRERDQRLPCRRSGTCESAATYRGDWIYRAEAAGRPWGASVQLCDEHAQEFAAENGLEGVSW